MTDASGRSAAAAGRLLRRTVRHRTVAPLTPPAPPGPRGRPLVGNTYDYERDRIGFLREMHARYGDCFRFSDSVVALADPDLIHVLFSRTNHEYRIEQPLFASEDDARAFAAGVERWMQSRRHGSRGMHRSVVDRHGDRLLSATADLLAPRAGRPADLLGSFKRLAGLSVAEYCVGEGATAHRIADAVALRAELATPFMTSSLTFAKWSPTRGVRRTLDATAALETAIRDAIAEARRERPSRDWSLLDGLLDIDPPLTDDQLTRFLQVTLLASHGSPGAAMVWMLRELAINTELAEALHEEAACHDDLVTAYRERKLVRTDAAVREILRLYPPTWLMGRVVHDDVELGRWTVRRGQTVMFSPYLVHRDPRRWERPDNFLADRWLSGPPPPRHAYFPFGAGPRICVGAALGTLQLVLVTALVARDHLVSSPNHASIPMLPAALLVPAGLQLTIAPRRG
ncbi:MAG: cytochrome P450 [Frankiaceae bacterium]